jgi:hypothetical protein
MTMPTEKYPPMTRTYSHYPYVELTAKDVGRRTLRAFGRTWLLAGVIGDVLPQDVGKRVYRVGDILQVENDEQLRARLAKGTE